MNTIYSVVIHSLKNHFNLTDSQYYVADTIDVLSRNGKWCYKSKANIARDLFLSPRAVGTAIKALIEKELIVKKNGSPSHLKTTPKWNEAREKFSNMIVETDSVQEVSAVFMEKKSKKVSSSISENEQIFPKSKQKVPIRMNKKTTENKEKKKIDLDSFLNF